MKSTFRLGLAFGIGLALVGSAFAQGNMPDKAPEKPTGKKRNAADHKESGSAVRTTEFSNPTAGFEGFSTIWPDGYYITTVKLKDGALLHTWATGASSGTSGVRRIASRQTAPRPAEMATSLARTCTSSGTRTASSASSGGTERRSRVDDPLAFGSAVSA